MGPDGDGEEGGKGDKRWFGIVTTAAAWKDVLEEAVWRTFGEQEGMRFRGVVTTGLTAEELHLVPEERVEERVKGAVREWRGEVGVVVLGCAGMVGMERWVVEEMGGGVVVVDGVRAGVEALQGLLRRED